MSNDIASPNLLLPQLTAFRILEVDAKHYPSSRVENVRSKSREKFSFDLEVQDAEDDENRGKIKTRITVKYSFDGEWRDSNEGEIIITLKSTYRGTFNFSEVVDPNAVEILMNQDLYRITLASQVYPLAQTHIEAQLRLMGVNSRRKPGLDPKILIIDNDDDSKSKKEELVPTKKRVRTTKTDK